MSAFISGVQLLLYLSFTSAYQGTSKGLSKVEAVSRSEKHVYVQNESGSLPITVTSSVRDPNVRGVSATYNPELAQTLDQAGRSEPIQGVFETFPGLTSTPAAPSSAFIAATSHRTSSSDVHAAAGRKGAATCAHAG